MNRIIFVFLLIFTGCSIDISESLFIASIGFEFENGELNGYFYLPLSNDVGKSEEEGKGTGEFVRVAGENIEKVFNNVKAVNSIDINLKHVSSVVLNEKLLNKEFIDSFINYVKQSKLLDYNFYFLATKEKMEEIYGFQNPNQETVLNSLLVVSGSNVGIRLVADPIHFLEFSKKFYSDRSILIPLLDIEELWSINNEKVKNFYPQSAIYYYKDQVVDVIKEKGSPYFREEIEFYDEIKKEPIYFSKYEMTLNRNGTIYIKLKYKTFSNFSITDEEVKSLVEGRMNEYLKKYKNLDPLDLYFLNKVYNSDLNYEQLKFHIVIEKN